MLVTPSLSSLRRMTALLLALELSACDSCGPTRRNPSSSATTPTAAPAQGSPPETPPRELRAVSLIELLPDCDVNDEGLVVDLGAKDSEGRSDVNAGKTPSGPRSVERGGAVLQQMPERRFARDFWLDEPTDKLVLRARVVGRAATHLAASIDDKRVGRVKLTKNEATTVVFAPTSESLAAGRHRLLLEAQGRASPTREPFYEIDWLNFSRTSDPNPNYFPPTARDLIADQELDGTPRRSIVLRSGNHIRCPLHLATNAQLDLDLGFWGTGTGTAEIGIVEEGQPKTTLHERKVTGGVGARWTHVSVDLTPYVGRVIGLELRAARTTQGGRIAFGEPRLTRTITTPPEQRKVKNIVIALMSGIERRLLPPWGPVGENTAMAELLRDSVAFHAYRVPSTIPGAVLASLLTGLAPPEHHVEDTAARFGTSLHPLSQIVKQAGGRAAMFTAVPTSFPAFGFNVGWDDFAVTSPVLDLPAETPVVEASRWLAQGLDQSRDSLRLLLMHLRGAHPPWDLSREQTAQLEPPDYAGAIEPRRGGIVLGKIRRQTARMQRRLNDEDGQRLEALMKAALLQQDAALAGLISTLKRRDAWDDTLFIVMGDVANAEPPVLPFDPTGSLREDQLTVPLIVKFPNRAHAGTSFNRPVATVDLTYSILEAAGLTIPEAVRGHSLVSALAGDEPLLTRPLVATLGNRYVSRIGVWLLSGELSGIPKLCQTDVDPACVEDQFSRRPLSSRALHQWTQAELTRLRRAGQSAQREPASIDAETAAALTVWGDIEM